MENDSVQVAVGLWCCSSSMALMPKMTRKQSQKSLSHLCSNQKKKSRSNHRPHHFQHRNSVHCSLPQFCSCMQDHPTYKKISVANLATSGLPGAVRSRVSCVLGTDIVSTFDNPIVQIVPHCEQRRQNEKTSVVDSVAADPPGLMRSVIFLSSRSLSSFPRMTTRSSISRPVEAPWSPQFHQVRQKSHERTCHSLPDHLF